MSLKDIDDFEKRFKAVMHEPGLAGKFSTEEIRTYLSDIAVSSIGHRFYPIYPELFRAFPAEVWFPVIGPLLDALQLMPQGMPYSSNDGSRHAIFPDGSQSEEPYKTFHPAVQLIHEALQCQPELFRDKLDLLFIHELNLYNDTEVRFWNMYGGNYYDFFKAYVSGQTIRYKLLRAIVYMLMSGGEKMESLAASTIQENFTAEEATMTLGYWLPKVGKAWTGNGFRALHSDRPLHIVFPEKYLPPVSEGPLRSPVPPPPDDSFLALKSLPHSHRFGGWKKIRTSAGKILNLHHVLTLDPIPESLGISSVKRLELVADLDELIDERTDGFHHHNTQGEVMIKGDEHWQYGWHEGEENQNSYDPKQSPFKPCTIRLSDQGERYRLQSRTYGENHFRIGGRPHFVQDYHYPKCCDCKQVMSFMLQLDSRIPMEDGDHWFWGSGGMAYVYWCDSCRVSSTCWFCT